MERLSVGGAMVAVVVAILACKGSKSDDAPPAASVTAAVTASAAPSASAPAYANVADVTRYPDEAPPDNVKAALTHDGMRVRTEVPNGTVVATLKKGQEVTALAEHGGFVLVAFPDPKDPSKTLIGWTSKGGFSAAAAATDTTDHVSSCPKGAGDYVGAPLNKCVSQCFEEKDCSKPCLDDYVVTGCSECAPGQQCLSAQHPMEDGVGWSKACIGRGKGCGAAPAASASGGGGACRPGFVKGTGPGELPSQPGCYRVCTKEADCDLDLDMDRTCKNGRCVADIKQGI